MNASSCQTEPPDPASLPLDAGFDADLHAGTSDEPGECAHPEDDGTDPACLPAAARAAGVAPAVGASEEQLTAWIAAIVERDERALAALYDATVSRVYGIVLRVVRRASLADEVVEDAYFQVWRQAVRFDPARGKALTWLLSMARTRAIDAVRSEARFQHEALDDDGAPELRDDAPGCDDLLDVARSHADLHRALMLLGDQPRQLVALAFFRGLSHEEIAVQTRLPLGTVKSQIRRALISLRQVLGEGAAVALAS